MRTRACVDHPAPDLPPIRLAIGDSVVAGERATQWPEFVFVTGEAGEGWVPARHLSGDSGTVAVETEYDTTELSVSVGQEVTVLERDDLSGWWWCRADDGRTGWVPVLALETAET